ncbi:MAG: lytic transglycosylase domain-containing protein [bacterium]|nr:lytic transglycosylase domain-containing protein [bacterium]
MIHWASQNIKVKICWGVTCICLAACSIPAAADEYNVKYTYDTSVNKVLTNVNGSNAFPDAVMGKPRGKSTYMQKAKARRQAAQKRSRQASAQQGGGDSGSASSAVSSSAKPSAARSSPTASRTGTAASRPAKTASRLAKAPVGKTVIRHTAGKLKIHTIDDDILPAPTIEYIDPGYKYSGETWAFATFDASKRHPRLVRWYGWHKDASGQQVEGWHEIDINPLILQAARDTGVDPLLVEIIMRYESNYNPYARSPAGAIGLMQLMPDTAGGLGISDVYNVRDNIRGGAQYIAYQLARFNSVPLALAAYNAGPGAVIEYGGVPPYAETQNYVRNIYGEYQAGLKYRQNHR